MKSVQRIWIFIENLKRVQNMHIQSCKKNKVLGSYKAEVLW
jgi:hypothetical protein